MRFRRDWCIPENRNHSCDPVDRPMLDPEESLRKRRQSTLMQQTRNITIGSGLLVLMVVFMHPRGFAEESSQSMLLSQWPCDAPSAVEPDVADASDRCGLENGLLGGLIPKSDHHNTGFADFNYYRDTRDFNVLTINAGAKLPCDFEYFQFVNYTSPLGESSELENWNDFFTEIHLRHPVSKSNQLLSHFDWNLMWADGGFVNEVGRFGMRWRLHDTAGLIGNVVDDRFKLRYAITLHFLEDDGSGWQVEHVFRRNFFEGLIYVGGFADHNINSAFGNSDWVAESQVGLKLGGDFYAVAEYRYNSFLPAKFRSGWGFGLEYVVTFQ